VRFAASAGIAVTTLLGCQDFREATGAAKLAPDEFLVITKAPLIIPPDYNLRPPTPGAPDRNRGTTADMARAALFGQNPERAAAALDGDFSQGERNFLARSGGSVADPAIRQAISDDSGLLDQGRAFAASIIEPDAAVSAENGGRDEFPAFARAASEAAAPEHGSAKAGIASRATARQAASARESSNARQNSTLTPVAEAGVQVASAQNYGGAISGMDWLPAHPRAAQVPAMPAEPRTPADIAPAAIETAPAPRGDADVPVPAPAEMPAVAAPLATLSTAPVASVDVPALAPAELPAVAAPLATLSAGAVASLVATPAPASASVAPTAQATSRPVAPIIVLQLGAYSSEARANAAWREFKTRHAAIVGSLEGAVQVTNFPDRGTLYRLRVGPFTDRSAASAMCAALKAEGGACMVAQL
jgi:hypothetical protein